MTVGGNEAGRPAGEATSVETAQALQLPKLSMPERELSHLPAGLENLHHLMDLDLSGNLISEVDPNSLPSGLYTLVLTGNHLECIPSGLVYLPDLQKLYLGANRITSCEGACFGPNLLHVGLSYNLISSIQGIADEAPAVMSLDLSNNKLEDMSATLAELKRLPHLRNVTLMGNPICLLKTYREFVKARLPKLVYLDGKALARADDLGQADQENGNNSAEGETQDLKSQEVLPPPEEPDAEGNPEAGPGNEDSGTQPMLVPLKMDLRTLIVKDPSAPQPPDWLQAMLDDAGGKAVKKGKGEDEIPRIPPVQYYIEFEGLEGESVATKMTKKVEVDPFTIAENAPKDGKSAEPVPKEKGKGRAKASSRDGAERAVTTYGSVLYQVPLTCGTRDWLRNGFKMKLCRLSKALKRKVEAEATEKEPEKFSYWLEEEEAIVGTGTCRAMDIVEGKSNECKVKVTFTEIPSLWDDKGIRMALYDERHNTDSTGSIVASFALHYEPPPEPTEPVAPAGGKGGKKK